MNQKITVYGLTGQQLALLATGMPDGYEIVVTQCVTDLVVADTVCSVVDTARLDREEMRALLCYYMDVGEWLDETVVWLGTGELPDLAPFVRYDSFLELLTAWDSILHRAQTRYDTMQMYSSEYADLPRHAIEESLEADVYAALRRRCGDSVLADQVRRQWQAVLEAGGAEELAAVCELTRWLARNKHPYRLEGAALSGVIPHLLGIETEGDLLVRLYGVGKKDASGDEVPYIFFLPEALQPRIASFLEHHWLKSRRQGGWIQPYENYFILGDIHFHFGAVE